MNKLQLARLQAKHVQWNREDREAGRPMTYGDTGKAYKPKATAARRDASEICILLGLLFAAVIIIYR